MMEVKKVEEELDIGNKKKVPKFKKKAKKLVFLKFYKQIYVFKKKVNKRVVIKKMWDHTIDLKKGFVPWKGKIHLLLQRERKVHKLIDK